MNKKYYFLSFEEYGLLSLFYLGKFITFFPASENDNLIDVAISYDCIDPLAREVYSFKNKRGKNYKKLVAFVDRLQDILENNPDIC